MEFKFFKRKEQPPQKPEKILPSDVRYAFQYKEGILNKEDIEILARSNFLNEATYLTFKSLVDDREKHKDFLQKYTQLVLNQNSLVDKKEMCKELIVDTLNKEEGEISVKGSKLAQISRQGFDLWQEKYNTLTEKLSTDERRVYILAHSTFIGLDSFLRNFAVKGKDLNILIPEWENSENFGYTIIFNGDKVEIKWLTGPLVDDKGSILVDDTKNTGNTIAQSQEFLIRNGLKNTEILVIDKAA